jgi:hypothetical protein
MPCARGWADSRVLRQAVTLQLAIQAVMSKWLPLAETLLSMVVCHIPDPISAQVSCKASSHYVRKASACSCFRTQPVVPTLKPFPVMTGRIQRQQWTVTIDCEAVRCR